MKTLDHYPYPSQRMPIFAKQCVATSQPLAAYAGLEALTHGGNAVDAALAAAITLTVVEPVSNSIGSDAFALIWDGQTLHGINGSGRAPASLSPQRFKGRNHMPHRGWDSVTVPGAVGTWVELSKRFGKLPFEQLFSRAITYARDGYMITPKVAHLWKSVANELKIFPEFCNTFLPNGRAPAVGSQFKLEAQARTLEFIRDSRGEAFYRGELAKKIAQQAQQENGVLNEKDLADFTVKWVDPISVQYRNVQVFEMPPNNGGLTALIALSILNEFGIADYPVDSVDSIHLQIEAMKLAFVDSQQYIGDPSTMRVTPEQLLATDRIKDLAAKIKLHRAQPIISPIFEQKGTVYLTTADSDGCMVSFIQSHYDTFGSGVVIKDTGIGMQNRGACFNLIQGHANEVGGGKYPYHTIMPSFVMVDGQPLMSFGVMGGHMQPQGQLQVLSRIIDYGQNPQTALDAPRWYISPTFEVSLEGGFAEEMIQALHQRGHKVEKKEHVSLYGGGQAIYKLDNGYAAASDPRKDGLAIGI